jgi:hypothetical protein
MTKSFGEKVALKEISFSVPAGQLSRLPRYQLTFEARPYR